MSKKGDYLIPFDRDGNQQHYPSAWYEGIYPDSRRVEPDWRNNDPFEDELTFVSFSRGRSAAYLDFKRKGGTSVTVFLKEFVDMVPHLVGGVVKGRFQFIKRGQNYGCILLEAK
jgi:hypothetical protein